MATSSNNNTISDLYQDLGIDKGASADEIKKAYRNLAKKYHPDKNQHDPNATEKFQKISHAYSILSDPTKKKNYDKYGTVDEDQWNYEEFMNNCGINFEELFDLGDVRDYAHPNHGLKLMILRKKANEETVKNEEDKNTKYLDGIPIEIYGKGKGYKSLQKLNLNCEWIDEEEDDDEEFEEVDDDDDGGAFISFLEDNTKEAADPSKLICKLCPGKKKISVDNIEKHFIDKHENDYKKSKYEKETPWDKAMKSYEKSKKDFAGFEKMFSGKGGMKDLESMFSEMLMGGMGMDMGIEMGKGKGKGKGKKKK